jgi:hypothetical protein
MSPDCRACGAVHEGPLEMERDEKRTSFLNGLGIRVIRFESRTVFDSLELLLNSIRFALSEQGRISGPHYPGRSIEGGFAAFVARRGAEHL